MYRLIRVGFSENQSRETKTTKRPVMKALRERKRQITPKPAKKSNKIKTSNHCDKLVNK